MVERFLNVNSFFPYELYTRIGEPFGYEHLSDVLSPSVAEFESCRERYIQIPDPVLDLYSDFRPTSLLRAERFEEAVGTDCEIYVKNEGECPSGTHKMNSACMIAHLLDSDGIQTVTTETTGNWGVALAHACREFSLDSICFIDAESNNYRPYTRAMIEKQGSRVWIVHNRNDDADLLRLSADAALQYTENMDGAVYVFGSVFGYFLIPQSIVGLEAKEQLEAIDRYPDMVIGSCGGGANLMGLSGVFIEDAVCDNHPTELYSFESEDCPILAQGRMGLFSIDSLGRFPFLRTYGLEAISPGEYIGGLGSTIVASSVAYFHSEGVIKSEQLNSSEARRAARIFFETEGIPVAVESGYQLAGAVKKAVSNHGKIILTNISSPTNATRG